MTLMHQGPKPTYMNHPPLDTFCLCFPMIRRCQHICSFSPLNSCLRTQMFVHYTVLLPVLKIIGIFHFPIGPHVKIIYFKFKFSNK